ncbi:MULTISPECIES: hypothetical protein [unclassified Microcoleus]|uniref:hypothetical protein n=1 Tax=unclassified Microcoleus TaxID=2642155 RepID=UPI002FCFCBA2
MDSAVSTSTTEASFIFADRIRGDRNHHQQQMVKLSRRLRINTDTLTAFPKH